jgi:antibiotic biosynthesis monooxygenase (ABM) superfamily enzyme
MATTLPSQAAPKQPRRYKQAIATWLAAYPTITGILAAFKPLGLLSAPLPLRTLVLTLILVPLMVFVLTPTLIRRLDKLLRVRRGSPR